MVQQLLNMNVGKIKQERCMRFQNDAGPNRVPNGALAYDLHFHVSERVVRQHRGVSQSLRALI